jgi:hypothetical protein
MAKLSKNLELHRCPHCSIAKPNLFVIAWQQTTNHEGYNKRQWGIYQCGNCGGLVSAYATAEKEFIKSYYPSNKQIDDDVPEKPRILLGQAQESLHAPSGAVMLAASAVDAMLKLRHLKDGSLYARIEKAVQQNLLTADMAKWAHEVRLDANDQRHADESADLPNESDAARVLDFALALAEILFVLPSRVTRGIQNN